VTKLRATTLEEIIYLIFTVYK